MSTDWEDHYQRGEIPWEKGGPSPGLVDFLEAERVSGRVLVPGCGLGHDVRALAASADEVVGIDIAPSAVKAARAIPGVGGERYELADLFNLPAGWLGTFDAVFEHTCFCAIQPSQREAYVASVAGALRPGGTLLAVFYLDPGNDSPDPTKAHPSKFRSPNWTGSFSPTSHSSANGCPNTPTRDAKVASGCG